MVAKIMTGVSFWRAMFAVWWNRLLKKEMSLFFLYWWWVTDGCSGMKVRWNDATNSSWIFFCLFHICTPESVDNIFTALNVRAALRWKQTHLQDKFDDLNKNKNRFLTPLYQEPDWDNKEKRKI